MQQKLFTLSEYNEILKNQPVSDETSYMLAKKYNSQLTKPEGSLGKLETLALFFAGWQGVSKPKLDKVQIAIFAGNHGVANQGVSAFPSEVTEQMVLNFKHGGAAINQLANVFDAKLDIYSLSLTSPTRDFTKQEALTEDECMEAINIGWNSVDPESDLFLAGEMGIANTTSAAAIAAALCDDLGSKWVGRGTGVTDLVLEKKIKVVNKGLSIHCSDRPSPLTILQRLGGREIAAIVGAISSARHKRIPFLLDGFICSAAALVLQKTQPTALTHVIAAHQSAENAHKLMLEELGLEPLLSLGLRLGEGSGAAVAIGVIKAAIACHSSMSTFSSAGVANKE